VEFLRIIDAELFDTGPASTAPGAAIAGAVDERFAGGRLGRSSERRRDHVVVVVIVVVGPAGSYVLVIVRTTVLFVHAHPRGGYVVVGLQPTW